MKKKIENFNISYFDVSTIFDGTIDEVRMKFNEIVDSIEASYEELKLKENLSNLHFETHQHDYDTSSIAAMAYKEETDEEFEARMGKYKIRNIQRLEKLIQRKEKLDQEVKDLAKMLEK